MVIVQCNAPFAKTSVLVDDRFVTLDPAISGSHAIQLIIRSPNYVFVSVITFPEKKECRFSLYLLRGKVVHVYVVVPIGVDQGRTLAWSTP